mmetsp:Transcript_83308/g.258689  ORF Transcript_83308/g.258689 Transcript_83308/m.258689 type:complete len:229 (-) Transcript_83308:1064-1750(-)
MPWSAEHGRSGSRRLSLTTPRPRGLASNCSLQVLKGTSWRARAPPSPGGLRSGRGCTLRQGEEEGVGSLRRVTLGRTLLLQPELFGGALRKDGLGSQARPLRRLIARRTRLLQRTLRGRRALRRRAHLRAGLRGRGLGRLRAGVRGRRGRRRELGAGGRPLLGVAQRLPRRLAHLLVDPELVHDLAEAQDDEAVALVHRPSGAREAAPADLAGHVVPVGVGVRHGNGP